MVRSLYTSADMEKDISITSDPADGFQSVWGHFGVVFQGQSSSVVKSDKLTRHKHQFFDSVEQFKHVRGSFAGLNQLTRNRYHISL